MLVGYDFFVTCRALYILYKNINEFVEEEGPPDL